MKFSRGKISRKFEKTRQHVCKRRSIRYNYTRIYLKKKRTFSFIQVGSTHREVMEGALDRVLVLILTSYGKTDSSVA